MKVTALPGTNRGTLSLSGTSISSIPARVTADQLDESPDDNLKYTPPDDANGDAFATFNFKVNDGELDSAASYTITVEVSAVDDAPEAEDDFATTNKNTAVVIDVLANDTDADAGTNLSVTTVGASAKGATVINADNTITYTPGADELGEDSFDYSVSDGTVTATALVTVTVTPNADLSALVIRTPDETVPLNESFTALTTSYTATVAHSVYSVVVTPIVAEAGATVTVNGTEVSGGDSVAIDLGAAVVARIEVAVTNEAYTKTYTIYIHRSAPPVDDDRDDDQVRPSVKIETEASAPVGGAFEVTITFSEKVTGFEPSDIQVTNGEVTDFSGSGRRYTVEITPSARELTVEVGAHAARDAAGYGNRAAAPLTIEADLTAPEVEITSEATGPVGGAFEVTITFSEEVTDFEGSDIQVTNGTVSDFGGSGKNYTVEITPLGER